MEVPLARELVRLYKFSKGSDIFTRIEGNLYKSEDEENAIEFLV